jgi:phosphoglycerate dehydrogenase-like enzyme
VKVAVPDVFRADLGPRLPRDVDVRWYATVDQVAAAAHAADVLVVGFIDADEIRAAIDSAPNARWVSTHAAGVDHYPLSSLRQRGVVLTKGAGINAAPIAEFVVLCVLSAAKGFPSLIAASQRGEWPAERSPASELDGTQAVILGYGNIGREVGARLKAFGVAVTGVGRSTAGWREKLPHADWVIVTAALTPGTRHLLGRHELSAMNEGAWLVNVSRGGVVDHDALADALEAGRPRGAYLDVTEPEPLPSTHRLWSLPDVVITGHSAGRSERSRQRYIELFLRNLERFRSGESLDNRVDYDAGY